VRAAGGQAEQRIAVATQWQLMWWRFRKHRLALGGTFVLLLFYLVSLFATSSRTPTPTNPTPSAR